MGGWEVGEEDRYPGISGQEPRGEKVGSQSGGFKGDLERAL